MLRFIQKIKTLKTEELLYFANQLSKNLNSENKYPDILSCFPENFKLNKRENFYPSNFMGYNFFKNVFTTEAKYNGENFKIFIACFSSKEEACNSLLNYFDYLKINKICENGKVYHIIDPINKDITLCNYEKFIIGLSRKNDKISEKIIEEIKSRLKNML